MSVYRVIENQTTKPLAPYLQPSQAGFVPSDASAHSARLTGTQVMGILLGIGCLILLFLTLSKPNAKSDLHGQWQNVALVEGRGAAQGEGRSSR